MQLKYSTPFDPDLEVPLKTEDSVAYCFLLAQRGNQQRYLPLILAATEADLSSNVAEAAPSYSYSAIPQRRGCPSSLTEAAAVLRISEELGSESDVVKPKKLISAEVTARPCAIKTRRLVFYWFSSWLRLSLLEDATPDKVTIVPPFKLIFTVGEVAKDSICDNLLILQNRPTKYKG
ncbi:hypothetical protein PIB30_037996 [Stylosanthes scabra]|uniref:Uncharacterized protein n=1 Tax=Stylosanthes scabra TaxID=79078 RepID=A0ABU6QDG0_9FABA|nr:hypothetical protein [Stylosanthes scabra]